MRFRSVLSQLNHVGRQDLQASEPPYRLSTAPAVGLAQEQEADRMADQMAGVQRGETRQNGEASAAVGMREDMSFGSAQGLPEPQRQFFEAHLGHDFSQVNLHTDRAAVQSAQEMQAQAFTVGNDIVFGQNEYTPDTAQGQHLLAHELTHVAQQGQTPGPPVAQRQPQDSPKSAGQPQEPYTTGSGMGPEDTFVLFNHNSAELTKRAQDKIDDKLATLKGAVTVELYGYASDDGGSTHNEHLSARRAIAVKQYVASNLPAGSSVKKPRAHGEISEFGSRALNRRVGLSIEANQPEGTLDPHRNKRMSDRVGRTLGGLGLGLPDLSDLFGPAPVLDLSVPTDFLDNSPTDLLKSGSSVLPTLDLKPMTLDVSFLGPLNAQRGLPIDDQSIEASLKLYQLWYPYLRGIGLTEKHAKKVLDLSIPLAVGTELASEYPTIFEVQDLESGTTPTMFNITLDAIKKAIEGLTD